MNICDRTWKRDGQPVPATVHVVISGPELDEEWHLSEKESDAVRHFIANPTLWERTTPSKKRGSNILGLKDKAKAQA